MNFEDLSYEDIDDYKKINSIVFTFTLKIQQQKYTKRI